MFLKKEPGLGVVFQSSPSCSVFIANGGLENGICREFLDHLLHPQYLRMPSGKDYAFASFSSSHEAEAVVKEYNGICVQGLSCAKQFLPSCIVSGPPLHLYLSYISQLPLLGTTPPTSSPLPPGLTLIEDFITPAEEEELMAFLDSTHNTHAHLKHRQVLHYGYEFNYATNNVDPSQPLPGGFPPLIQILVSKLVASGHVQYAPDQLTINRYPPGAGMCVKYTLCMYTCHTIV